MKAVVVKEPGGAEQLLFEDFSNPMPGKTMRAKRI